MPVSATTVLSTVYRRCLHVMRGRRAPASASELVPPTPGLPGAPRAIVVRPPAAWPRLRSCGSCGGWQAPQLHCGRCDLTVGNAGNVPAFVIRGPSRAAGSNARTSHRHALEKTTRQPAPRFLSKRGTWASRWKGVASLLEGGAVGLPSLVWGTGSQKTRPPTLRGNPPSLRCHCFYR